jgi:cysteinyl-tRNA synthetase
LDLFVPEEVIEVPKEIQELAKQRREAKQQKDWFAADLLRAKIEAL